MPLDNPSLRAFTSGVLSPRLDGRTDVAWYHDGTRIQNNLVSLPHGPADRRPGFRLVETVKDQTKFTRVLPFEFSVVQAYAIETGASYFRFYRDGGRIENPPGTPVEVASPYAEADLAAIKKTQSADILYLFQPDFMTRKLQRTSHVDWTLTKLALIDGPYLDENTTATTLTPSGTTGAITITASAVTGINDGQGFLSTDVGRLVRINHSGTWGWAEITGVTSTTLVDADVKGDFASATASSAWRLGLYSDTTGYPVHGVFHQQRLWLGGAKVQPNRFDGSKTADFENFTPGANDDDAITYVLDADQVTAIRWLASSDVLIVGTAGHPFKVTSGQSNPTLTPTNIEARPATRRRCADAEPLPLSNVILFLQRAGASSGGRKLRELVFSLENDSYVAPDLLRRAEHLANRSKRITELAYQEEPWSIVWAVRSDGALLGFTYEREEQVTAWHPHPLGGGGVVESIATIPGGGEDELWAVVKRTINGATARFIERLDPFFDDDTLFEDAFFVDAGLSYDGAATSTISGLDHLEGETVQVLATTASGTAVHPDRVVSAGAITLDYPVTKAQVGLGYTARLKPVRLEAGAARGTAQGKVQRISEVVVRLDRSLGFKIGRSEALADVVPFRSSADPMGAAPALFTGDIPVSFRGNYERDAPIEVLQEQPLPLTLVAIFPRMATEEK